MRRTCQLWAASCYFSASCGCQPDCGPESQVARPVAQAGVASINAAAIVRIVFIFLSRGAWSEVDEPVTSQGPSQVTARLAGRGWCPSAAHWVLVFEHAPSAIAEQHAIKSLAVLPVVNPVAIAE